MPRSFLLKRGREELPAVSSDELAGGGDRQRQKLLRISLQGAKDRLGKSSQDHYVRPFARGFGRSADGMASLPVSPTDNYDDQLESKLDVLIRAAQHIMKHDSSELTVTMGQLGADDSFDEQSVDGAKGKPNRHRRRHISTEPDETEEDEDEESVTSSSEGDTKAKYECTQCGRQFKTRYTLTIHQRMPDHTKSRPFVCNVCGKGFRLSSTLCRHKIIHTEEKPHKCKTCNKAFNRSSTLKTHLKTHSPVKEFNCDVCGKGFHQKGNLRNHVLIHTGEKPYKCDLCDRAFNKLSNLKFHLQTHDQAKSFAYRCTICDCPFEKKLNLKEHMEAAH